MGCWLVICLAFSRQMASAPTPDGLPELERRMVELVNAERAARDIAPLRSAPELAQVARDYSARMAETGQINHDLARPVEQRIREVRPDICMFGENVSKHTSIDYSLGDLMLSPGHRSNILNTRFTEIGVGIVRGDDGFLYITQEFTRPCGGRIKHEKRSQT